MMHLTSLTPWWWLAALSVLVPLWLHRQKRQRNQTQTLATARFLPAVRPQQQRIWRWLDLFLLSLRCLLLLGVIALLAQTTLAWRGDTVWIAAGVDPVWAEQQIQQAQMGNARRRAWCLDEQDGGAEHARTEAQGVRTCPDFLTWLAAHERGWRSDARMLVLLKSEQTRMPARPPQLQHALMLRVQAPPQLASASAVDRQVVRHVVLVSPHREAQWRRMLAAFEQAGLGTDRYTIASTPQSDTALVIWDDATRLPPSEWRAPLWWIGASPAWPALKEAAVSTRGQWSFAIADSAQGRLWQSGQWPPTNVEALRSLYQAWQELDAALPAFPLLSQDLPAGLSVVQENQRPEPPLWIAFLLLGIFALERLVSHARRV